MVIIDSRIFYTGLSQKLWVSFHECFVLRKNGQPKNRRKYTNYDILAKDSYSFSFLKADEPVGQWHRVQKGRGNHRIKDACGVPSSIKSDLQVDTVWQEGTEL